MTGREAKTELYRNEGDKYSKHRSHPRRPAIKLSDVILTMFSSISTLQHPLGIESVISLQRDSHVNQFDAVILTGGFLSSKQATVEPDISPFGLSTVVEREALLRGSLHSPHATPEIAEHVAVSVLTRLAGWR